mgnify:CR=1 FL=1
MINKTPNNAIFITNIEINPYGDGIAKKILSQVDALRKLGYAVDLAHLENRNMLLNESTGQKNKIYLPIRYLFFKSLSDYINKKNIKYSLAYIRNPHGGLYPLFFLPILKTLRSQGTKIIIDVPNYPYDQELTTRWEKTSLLCHKAMRKHIRNYVDLISYTGKRTQEIWGVKAVQIYNSCDPKDIPRPTQDRRTPGSIRFIGVANLAPWHGYDRLIHGIHDYYLSGGNQLIEFHIAGNSEPTFSFLKNLAKKLGIHEKIIFHGKLDGKDLNCLFDNNAVGVDALGRHRSGNNYNDSIKSKEYTFRGIPFIKSHADDSFLEADFAIDVPANEDPIDIRSVILKLNSIKSSPLEITNFGMAHFRWEEQIAKLLADY